MRLVLRRARGVRFLLLAAGGATLVATALLTGLAGYSVLIVDAGARTAVAAAPPGERSLLVTGDAGETAADIASRDDAVRAAVVGAMPGHPVTVSAAGYAIGLGLAGPTGTAVPDRGGDVFARTMFLDDLAGHAELVAGVWPRPGEAAPEVSLAQAAATVLGARPGDLIPVLDRRSGVVADVALVGVWRPRDLADPYWLLTPGVETGSVPGSATYGPIVAHRDDFLRLWSADASIGWIVMPDLSGSGVAGLARVEGMLDTLAARLPNELAQSPQSPQIPQSPQSPQIPPTALTTTTGLPHLVDRLTRAELVGRSALLTPMLFTAVLAGSTLLLVALLINEQRRGETELMRARGASRRQLAGVALGEAALVVTPAALLAAPLAVALLAYADRLPLLAGAALHLRPSLTPAAFLVAGLGALGCLLAMLGPALRRPGTYLSELTSRFRPSRRALAQRAGIDLALVGFAVLGWLQLRQYASPLAGAGGRLGIDPVLASAPTMAVLAGAVLAMRLLGPLSRMIQRRLDRSRLTAATFGMWQAGRRPHTGSVLLLALAVGACAAAWSLAATSTRSLADQADHRVGADLRLVERGGFAPAGRFDQIAGLPGVRVVLPVQRDLVRLGPRRVPTELVALDARAAPGVVRLRADLAGGAPDEVLTGLAAARGDLPGVALPASAARLHATISVQASQGFGAAMTTQAVLRDDHGGLHRVELGRSVPNDAPGRFDAVLPDLPGPGGHPLTLVGFQVMTLASQPTRYTWALLDVATTTAAGTRVEVDLTGTSGWRVVDAESESQSASQSDQASGGRGEVHAAYVTRRGVTYFGGARAVTFSVVVAGARDPVAVLATGESLRALGVRVGDTAQVDVAGVLLDVRVVGEVAAVPGTEVASALLADLPALAAATYQRAGVVRDPQEHWVSTGTATTDTATTDTTDTAPTDPAPTDPVSTDPVSTDPVSTDPATSAAAAAAARSLPGVETLDRLALAADAARDPFGVGGRSALFAAALGALLLAVVGLAVDVRATIRRRAGELAVLRTLGAGPGLLARAHMAENAFLAAIGVSAGALVGIAVAATMAPLVILTPAARRPMPDPVLVVPWVPLAATAVGLLAVSVVLGGLAALRQRPAAAQLRVDETHGVGESR